MPGSTCAKMVLVNTEPTEVVIPWRTPPSIHEYGEAIKKRGNATLFGDGETIWTRFDNTALVRVPIFQTTPLSQHYARELLRRSRTGIITFLLEPDGKKYLPNAWLYTCCDQSYALEKLPNEVRRHVRRAQSSLRIEPLDWQALLEKGLVPYSDTRTRLGLSDGSLAHFKERFELFSSYPGHYAVGAWKGDTLAAYMTLIVVHNWVVIEGSFSSTAELELRPNNGLAHYVLDHFLVKMGFKTVCFGTSSIQEVAQKSGLHTYKTRIGFSAKPVHRGFMVHPLMRPLLNPILLWSAKKALLLRPGDPRLLKAIGFLNYFQSDKRNAV